MSGAWLPVCQCTSRKRDDEVRRALPSCQILRGVMVNFNLVHCRLSIPIRKVPPQHTSRIHHHAMHKTPRRDAKTNQSNTLSSARGSRCSSNSLGGRLADLQRLQQENDDLKRELRRSQTETDAVEQRLRDYEGDVLLSRANVDSDADDQEAIELLRLQLERAEQVEAESTRRLHECQADLKWMKDIAEALEVDLHQSREAHHKTLQAAELEAKVHQETIRHTTAELAKATEELERWKALATVREGLLSATQAHVKTLNEGKQKLEYAITCCQRWADKRLQELEKAREDLDAENCRLRATSTSIQEAIQTLERKLDESEQSFLEEEALYHDELDRRAARINKLTARVGDLEQQLESTAPASAVGSPPSPPKESASSQDRNSSALQQIKRIESSIGAYLERLRGFHASRDFIDAVSAPSHDADVEMANPATPMLDLDPSAVLPVKSSDRKHNKIE